MHVDITSLSVFLSESVSVEQQSSRRCSSTLLKTSSVCVACTNNTIVCRRGFTLGQGWGQLHSPNLSLAPQKKSLVTTAVCSSRAGFNWWEAWGEIKIEGFGGRPLFSGWPGALGPMGHPLNPALRSSKTGKQLYRGPFLEGWGGWFGSVGLCFEGTD